MKRFVLVFFCVLGTLFLVACAAWRPKPMDLCNAESKPDIPQPVLTTALSEAQAYSDDIYGPDCVVCAEVFAETPVTFKIHITSPADPEMLLNTSAEVQIRRIDGAVVSKGQYHSCYVHRIHRSGT